MSERVDVVLDDDSFGPLVELGSLYRESSRAGEVISFAYDDDYLALSWPWRSTTATTRCHPSLACATLLSRAAVYGARLG